MSNGSGVTGYQIQNLITGTGGFSQQLFSNGITPNATFVDNVFALNVAYVGRTVLLHNGGTAGTVSFQNFYPPAGFLLVTLVNTDIVSMTLTAPDGGNISGQGSIVMGPRDIIQFAAGYGGSISILNSWLQPVNCSIQQLTPQALAANTPVTIIPDTTIWDVGSSYTLLTGSFTPKWPGTYTITATVGLDASGSGSQCNWQLAAFLNGSTLISAGGNWDVLLGTQDVLSTTGLVQMNGSTDTVTLVATQDSTGDATLATEGVTFFATRTSLF